MARIGQGNEGIRLQQTLQRLRAKKADANTPAEATSGPANATADGFVSRPAPKLTGPAAGAFVAQVGPKNNGLGALGAQIMAMQGTAPTAQVRRNGAHGVEIHKPVVIETAADLEQVAGATAIFGPLSILESGLNDTDLRVLASLEFVQGNIAVEGNFSVSAIEALSSLKKTEGALYFGFNPTLAEVSLPQLEQVGRGLIFEGNASLVRVHAPALESLGGYLHIHENETLKEVSLPALKSLGGELSIVDNPRLVKLVTGGLDAHDDVELDNNALSFKL